ncbi:MAG: DoxX family protein [Chloroflexi bacterium]|nr:DoxX family protein [Chloroflexota bacterium]
MKRSNAVNRLLWTLQALLAAVFLFSGLLKLLVPVDQMQQQLPLPAALIYLIGTLETLGAFGLILPSVLRIYPALTPLAAAGLTILMACATVLTPLLGDPIASASLPLCLGILAAFVAYGRARRSPIAGRTAAGRALNLASR